MKKLFTLFAAVLASFSLWAVEPTFESYDWTEADVATVAGDHDGIVISYAGLGNPGNVSGHWYIPNNQNLKNSDSEWKYFGISADAKIDSISILYCPNGTNKTNIAWVAWGKDVEPNQYVLAHGLTDGTTSSKSWDNAIWETIDLSDVEDAYTVYTSRSVREFREIGASSNLANFGEGQTINILGIRVYLNNGTPAVTYTVTYKANNGINQADVIDDKAKKVKDNMFEAEEGFKFAGWNTAEDGSGTDYAVGTALESDLTLYAQWAQVCYEASYDLVNGIGSAEVTAGNAVVNEGVSLVLTASADRITITPAEGETFHAGDIIEFSGTVGNASRPFGIKFGGNTYEAASVTPVDPDAPEGAGTASYTGVLKADAETIEIARDGGTTTTLLSLVIKHEVECKDVDHTEISLVGVAVNGEALADDDVTELILNGSIALTDEFVEAPTVTFTEHTDIYYVGEETPKSSNKKIDVVAEEKDGKWVASQKIGENTYTITAVKPSTVTVTYMDGETVLGEEVLKKGETIKENAKYEAKPLAEFKGWFTDAELTNAADLTAAVNADLTLYGKFEKAFAKSLNIEQLVLDEGTGADIKAILTARGYAYSNLNALDSLNDDPSKDNRNYAFLGLKLKTAGAYVAFNLKKDQLANIRFGNMGADVKILINDDEENVLTYTNEWANTAVTDDKTVVIGSANGDVFVKIVTTSSATVVIKQIMIDEDIQTVVLPDAPEAIDNTKAAVKAQKMIRDGQLIIIRDGKELNVLGTVIR